MATKLEILIRARDEFSAELKRMEGNLQRSQRDLTRVGFALGAVGAAGVAGFGLAVKSAIDFESSFAGVRKTVDATEEEFARLEEGFRSMARQTPINVNEINRIGEAAGQLGIKVKNIEGFTKVMADLGVATNLASDEAATALARLANITQLPQTEFDRLGSTVVALGNNLATTEREIVDFGLRLAGAGKQIGLSEAQILALGGALSSVGISAEAGGTAFSRVMIDIAKAVDSGGEKLEEFARVAGLTVEEFRDLFERDAAEAIVTFVEGLGRIQEEGGSTFQVLEDLGQGNIRVRDALLRASGAGDLMRESMQLGSRAWEENTALTEEAEKRYATMASQLKVLQNNINDVAIDIGEDLVPILRTSVEGVQASLDVWRQIPEPLREAGARLGFVASGMALVSGGFLIMLPRMMAGVRAFQALRAQTGLLGTSMRLLPGVFAAAAVGILVLPPVISKINQLLKDAERGFSEGGVRREVSAFAEEMRRMGIDVTETGEQLEQELMRRLGDTGRELESLTDKWLDHRSQMDATTSGLSKVAEAFSFGLVDIESSSDRINQHRETIVALIQTADQLGFNYRDAMRMVTEAGLDVSDEIIKNALEPLMKAELASLGTLNVWEMATIEAFGGVKVAGIEALGTVEHHFDRLKSAMENHFAPLNAQIALIGNITGLRTQEALALDLQANALEQAKVAAQLARPAFEQQIRAVEREIRVFNLGKAAIEAQIDARNRLASKTLELARLTNLPNLVRQKELDLERAKILKTVGGETDDLTEAQKKLLTEIDEEMRALQSSIDVKTIEAELTNLQREKSDDYGRSLKDQVQAIEDQIGTLGRQRGHLDLVASAYQDNLSGIDDQIAKLGLQRQAIDLVTTAWKLQAEAMLALPSINEIQTGLQVLSLVLSGAISPQRITQLFDLISKFGLPTAITAQHGFMGETSRPTLFMTSETGAREGVQITPGGLPGGGRVIHIEPHFHFPSMFAPDRAQLEEAVREAMPEIRRQLEGGLS